jgi:hypothetical protein
MFAKFMGTGWYIRYVGQCSDASDRFTNHERWNEAVRDHGVTHVLTHISAPNQTVRETEERDLIQAFDPPMNVQHRPSANALRDIQGLGLGALSGLFPSDLHKMR